MKVSPREMAIIECMCEDGLSRKETADELGLHEGTVKNYITRILDRAGLSRVFGMRVVCFRYGRWPDWFRVIEPNPGPPLRGKPVLKVISAHQAGRIQTQAERRREA